MPYWGHLGPILDSSSPELGHLRPLWVILAWFGQVQCYLGGLMLYLDHLGLISEDPRPDLGHMGCYVFWHSSMIWAIWGPFLRFPDSIWTIWGLFQGLYALLAPLGPILESFRPDMGPLRPMSRHFRWLWRSGDDFMRIYYLGDLDLIPWDSYPRFIPLNFRTGPRFPNLNPHPLNFHSIHV